MQPLRIHVLAVLISTGAHRRHLAGYSAGRDRSLDLRDEEARLDLVRLGEDDRGTRRGRVEEHGGKLPRCAPPEVVPPPQESAGRLDSGVDKLQGLALRVHHEQRAVIASALIADHSEKGCRVAVLAARRSKRDAHGAAAWSRGSSSSTAFSSRASSA